MVDFRVGLPGSSDDNMHTPNPSIKGIIGSNGNKNSLTQAATSSSDFNSSSTFSSSLENSGSINSPSTYPAWSVSRLEFDRTRSLMMKVLEKTISLSYLSGNPEAIVETLRISALNAIALGELKLAFKWSSESESLAKALKDVASSDDAGVVLAYVELLTGEHNACVERLNQLKKSHGDGLEDFKVLTWSVVLGLHARIALRDINGARELAAMAPDLLVFAAYLNDSSKANLLAACTLVDLYTHNLALQPLAVAMETIEKTFQIFDVDNAQIRRVEEEHPSPEQTTMLASSFQLQSTLSLIAMLRVLLAILCNHHVLHGDTRATTQSPTNYGPDVVDMPDPKMKMEKDAKKKNNRKATQRPSATPKIFKLVQTGGRERTQRK